MPPWLYLTIAIAGEVLGTAALRATEGFTRPIPSLLTILGYGGAFYMMSHAVRQMPVGAAYAIWAGCGTALAAIVGWLFLKDELTPASIIGVSLIVAGVVVLNLTGK